MIHITELSSLVIKLNFFVYISSVFTNISDTLFIKALSPQWNQKCQLQVLLCVLREPLSLEWPNQVSDLLSGPEHSILKSDLGFEEIWLFRTFKRSFESYVLSKFESIYTKRIHHMNIKLMAAWIFSIWIWSTSFFKCNRNPLAQA